MNKILNNSESGKFQNGLELRFVDRLGQAAICDLSVGNICILSVDEINSASIMIQIMDAFIKAHISFKTLDVDSFCALRIEDKKGDECQYLIRVDPRRVSLVQLSEVVRYFQTKFIFKFPGIEIDPRGKIMENYQLVTVIESLDAEFILINHPVSPLNDDDFTMIFDEFKSLCCFKSNYGETG